MTEMEETLTGFKWCCKIYVSFPRANGDFNEVKFLSYLKKLCGGLGHLSSAV